MDSRLVHPEQEMEPPEEGWKRVEVGKPGSLQYRIFYQDTQGRELSPWHDIPLLSSKENKTVNFVCLTPAGQWAEFESSSYEPYNPLKLVKRDNCPSHYREECVSWTLGYLPQTWAITEEVSTKDPTVKERKGSPLEALIMKTGGECTGKVMSVKVLGAFAVRDKNHQLRWKLLGVNCKSTDPSARYSSLNEISLNHPQLIGEAREWLRTCHAASLEEQNKFANSERPMGSDWAMRVVSEGHANWQFVNKDKPLRLGEGSWVPPASHKARTAKEYASLWSRFTKSESTLSISLSRPTLQSQVHLDLAWAITSVNGVKEARESSSSDDDEKSMSKTDFSESVKTESEESTPRPKSPASVEKLLEKKSTLVHAKPSSKLLKFLKGIRNTFRAKSGPGSAKFKLSEIEEEGPGLTGLNFGFRSGVIAPRVNIFPPEPEKEVWGNSEHSMTFPHNVESPSNKSDGSEAATSPAAEDSPDSAAVPRNRRFRRRYPKAPLPTTSEDSAVDKWQEDEIDAYPLHRQDSLPTEDGPMDIQAVITLSRNAQSGPMRPREIVRLSLPSSEARKSKFREEGASSPGSSGTLAPRSGTLAPRSGTLAPRSGTLVSSTTPLISKLSSKGPRSGTLVSRDASLRTTSTGSRSGTLIPRDSTIPPRVSVSGSKLGSSAPRSVPMEPAGSCKNVTFAEVQCAPQDEVTTERRKKTSSPEKVRFATEEALKKTERDIATARPGRKSGSLGPRSGPMEPRSVIFVDDKVGGMSERRKKVVSPEKSRFAVPEASQKPERDLGVHRSGAPSTSKSGPMEPRSVTFVEPDVEVTVQRKKLLGPEVSMKAEEGNGVPRSATRGGRLSSRSGPMEPIGSMRYVSFVDPEESSIPEEIEMVQEKSTARRRTMSSERLRFENPGGSTNAEESEEEGFKPIQRAQSLGTAEAQQLASLKAGSNDLYGTDLYPPPRIPVRIPARGQLKNSQAKAGRDRRVSFLFDANNGQKEEVSFRRSITESNWDTGHPAEGENTPAGEESTEVSPTSVLPLTSDAEGQEEAESRLAMMTRSGTMIARTFDWQDRDFGRSRKPAARLARSANVTGIMKRKNLVERLKDGPSVVPEVC